MINVTKTSMPDFDEYCEEIKDLWDSHRLTNMGPKHKKLQAQLEDYFGCKHVTLYTNGHLALENILETYNFPKGSEVITTPFSFASTTHAIVRNDLVPVFCDIKNEDYTIDADKIESLITDKTAAILPVHVYGNICDVEKIENIAKKHNLLVIYDAAHAFGVEYKGKSSALFGDVSMFSFHATKVFNTIEGGCLCYSDDDLVQKLNDIKNFGIHSPESVEYVGGNAKMNEFQAAMGICNLKHINEEIKKRKKVFDEYKNKLSGLSNITLPIIQENVKSNFAYYPVLFNDIEIRDKVFNTLLENDIYSRKYFYPLISDYKCYENLKTADSSKTPIAKKIANCILTLPIYSDLSLDDVNKICKIIKETL